MFQDLGISSQNASAERITRASLNAEQKFKGEKSNYN